MLVLQLFLTYSCMLLHLFSVYLHTRNLPSWDRGSNYGDCTTYNTDTMSLRCGNKNVVILTKFSSLAALEVVILATYGAASDENFIKMETFSFQCRGTNEQSYSWPWNIWMIFFPKFLFLFPMWFIPNVIFFRLVQCNRYLISTVDTDGGILFSTMQINKHWFI